MTVTLRTIADHTRLSLPTVSQALNNTGRISEKTRRRVLKASAELGYRPHMAARVTRTGRTGLIGMIRNPSLGLSVHQPLFTMGLDEGLHSHGLCLVSELLDDSAEIAPRIVREKAVDGVIINYAFEAPAPIQDLLDRCRIPAVRINCKWDHNCVRPDDEGAAFEATTHLIRHGHVDIAYLSLHNSPEYFKHYSQQDRKAGYLHAMQQAGLSPRAEYLHVPEDAVARTSGWLREACVDYLRRPDRPSAVLCNLNGRVMLHGASLAGLRVPQDLSLIAFDDDVHADEWEMLDRVLVPYWSMGQAVASELNELIEHPDRRRDPLVVPFGFDQGKTVARLGNRR